MADLDLYRSIVDAYYTLSPNSSPNGAYMNANDVLPQTEIELHDTYEQEENEQMKHKIDVQSNIEVVTTQTHTTQIIRRTTQQQLHARPPDNILKRGHSRCGTSILLNADNLDENVDEKIDETELNEYGFGIPFSYWKEYTYYEYVAAKYGPSNLKEELLNNQIEALSITEWDSIYNKAQGFFERIESVLGQKDDRNTPFAHYDKEWNKIMKIDAGQKISLPHLLSILFYTDLSQLPCKMKNVCRKVHRNESRADVKIRHSELCNWMRLLFETIVLYGNHLSVDDGLLLYHGLNQLFYFKEFKAKFFIPTSTTSERSIARNFALSEGIILEFGGIETVGDPYFQTASLSRYSEEKEFLFFFAEIPIKTIMINAQPFDMSSLSLYQSIINGNIIIDKVQNKKKKFQKAQKALKNLLEEIQENNEDDNDIIEVNVFGRNLLKQFVNKTDKIWINAEEIKTKITYAPLRSMFIQQNDDKSFAGYSPQMVALQEEGKITLHDAAKFSWDISFDEINSFLNEGTATASKAFKCSNKLKFHCQMNERGEKEEQETLGRMSLFLYKIPKAMKKENIEEITVSFDLYCKKMNNFYCRFHDIVLKEGQGQGIDFKLDLLRKSKAVKKKKPIEWEISIMIHSFCN